MTERNKKVWCLNTYTVYIENCLIFVRLGNTSNELYNLLFCNHALNWFVSKNISLKLSVTTVLCRRIALYRFFQFGNDRHGDL